MIIRYTIAAMAYRPVNENLYYEGKNVLIWFKINSKKATHENLQFIILSKSGRPNYNTFINSNVAKEYVYEIASINHRKQTEF